MFVSLQDEEEFWIELQKKYLEPLPVDKEKQKKIANDLRELRNKVCAQCQHCVRIRIRTEIIFNNPRLFFAHR